MESATILLADDEALLLIELEGALADAGFLVLAVTSGLRAIELLNSADSEIAGVVTDIPQSCQSRFSQNLDAL